MTKSKAPMWCNLMGIYGLVVFVLCLGLPRSAATQIEFPCLFVLTVFFSVAHLNFFRAVVGLHDLSGFTHIGSIRRNAKSWTFHAFLR